MKIKIPEKMEKSVYKRGILLVATFLLISLAINAQNEVTKDYHKEYTAKKGTTLDLNNRYGNIVVATSATDQVVIDVKVTVRYPNKEKAERLLSYIDVQFTESDDRISAKTVIDNKFSFTGWGGDSRRFTINYNVKMPESMDIDLTNRYGDTDLDDLNGLVNLDIKYGDLSASKLARGNEKPLNSLYLAYGKGTIDEAGWLDATIRYCGNFTLSKSQALLLDSRYSTLHIGKISSVVADSKYDKLNIETINNLVLNSGYADINIGTLEKKLEFEGGYGSLSIDRVPAGFESLDVQSRYIGVRMGIDESASYNLDARVSYGGLKFNDENFQNRKRIIGNNSSEVSGTVGKNANPSSEVKVSSSYGTVKLY
jgi:hypothetical protein